MVSSAYNSNKRLNILSSFESLIAIVGVTEINYQSTKPLRHQVTTVYLLKIFQNNLNIPS